MNLIETSIRTVWIVDFYANNQMTIITKRFQNFIHDFFKFYLWKISLDLCMIGFPYR